MPERCPRCTAELADAANFCARCGASVSTPSAPDERDPLIGSVVLGRYRVVRLLGEGGMGQVYLAEQAMGQATRPVALKTLRKELTGNPKVSGRFMRESEIVIRLAHPNTIQFYDFGRLDDGTMAIVMEYIEGRTLADELAGGPLPLERVEALMTQICGSLAEAHTHGIVHRDLKPQNILLTRRAGRDDFVKVVDFGIALRASEDDQDPTRLTTHGTLVGTPPYMSPEQFQDRDVDARSDVYSLGVMLYRMLTGELPFEAKNPWQWAAAHIDQPPKPIAEHVATRALPRERADAVMRALAKDPADRPRDAAELLRDFTGVSPNAADRSVPDAAPQRATPAGPSTDASATAPTLHAAETSSRAHGGWLSWLPVGLLVAAGAVITWRGAGVDGDRALEPAASEPRPARAQTSPRARTGSPEARRARAAASGDATSTAASPSAVPAAEPDASRPVPDDAAGAALERLRAALDRGELTPALSTFASARRAVGPDHPELERLGAQLLELAMRDARRLARAGECRELRALSAAVAAARTGGSPGILRLLETCDAPTNFREDAGQNSGNAE